jgi:hypothetical protein
MRSRLGRLAVMIALVTVTVLAAAVPAQAASAPRYEVTITNLTDGQPLTPPVLAVHRRPVAIFSVGHPASLGVQEIAENGNPAPLIEALESDPQVVSVVAGTVPIVPTDRTDVSGLRLPRSGSITVHTVSYDAGTEINTEKFADIVPPCQGLIGVTGDPGTGTTNPALAEGGVIHMHEGIQGNGDLIPSVHGWTDPVAVLTITAL